MKFVSSSRSAVSQQARVGKGTSQQIAEERPLRRRGVGAFAVLLTALVSVALLPGDLVWAQKQSEAPKRPPTPTNALQRPGQSSQELQNKLEQEQRTRRAARPSRRQPLPTLPKSAQPPAVPRRAMPMVGNGRFLPADVPVRSLEGVTGFKKGTTRLQVGGAFGSNVQEKVVNVTRAAGDDRTPFYSADEQFLYVASNRGASGRYHLYRVSSGAPADPSSANPAVALTDPNDARFDYLFPAISPSGNQVAFVRAADTGTPVVGPNGRLNDSKGWRLFVANLPVFNQTNPDFIDTVPGNANPGTGGNDLRPLTELAFNGANFASIGRPTWLGGAEIVFAGRLEGEAVFHLYVVNVASRAYRQITAGPADERNPAVSPDNRMIAFDSNAVVNLSAPAQGQPASYSAATPTVALGVNPSFKRNLFIIPALGGQAAQFTGRYNGAIDTNNEQPAWSSLNANNTINPAGTSLYLAFASTRQVVFDPSDTTGTVVTGYNEPAGDNASLTRDVYYALVVQAGSPPGVEGGLNSPRRAIRLDTADPAINSDGANPTFQYNDEYPSWAPFISVQRIAFQSNRSGHYIANGFPGPGTGFQQTGTVNEIFIATVIDITAPTLLRYDTSSAFGEIVHINKTSATDPKFDPNSSVRTRDDGILPGEVLFFTIRVEDREAGLRPNQAAYIQIKNPNGKYQSQNQGGNGVERKEYANSLFDFATGTFVQGAYAILEPVNGAQVPLQISDTSSGITLGSEYESEALGFQLDPTAKFYETTQAYHRHRFNNLGNGILPEAGIDDFQAFSGSSHPPVDGSNGAPSVWIELKPLETTPPSGGGILYGAAVRVPAELSDWNLDVILYDNAVNPFAPNERSNFIIYDDVWGFSSALPLSGGTTDILVVSDYPSGQNFFRTRFGNENANNNLLPLFYSAESYYTDRDTNRMPGPGSPAPPNPAALMTPRIWDERGPFLVTPATVTASGGQTGFGRFGIGIPNTLGVRSYTDEFLVDGEVNVGGDGSLPQTSRYSIWRVLSRGPVPPTLLQAYLPQQSTRPPDTEIDPITNQPFENPDVQQPVVSASRMVVWASPFSGLLFVGSGHITDARTQQNLSDYVQAGGRLFIFGQDIAASLANQSSNFLSQTLGATFQADRNDSLTVDAARASDIATDPWVTSGIGHSYGEHSGQNNFAYTPVDDDPIGLTNNFVDAGRGDGAWTSAPGIGNVEVGRNDQVAAAADAFVEFSYANGGGALISKIHNPTGNTGRTAFAAFGYEGMSNEWYTYTPPGMMQPVRVATRARRAELMHNIVCAFRTGVITGRMIDNNGNPIPGALVRAATSIAALANRSVSTALTDSNGNFVMVGLPPGNYVISGVKRGYNAAKTANAQIHGASRNAVNVALKLANPGGLTGFPITTATAPPGNQGGVFRSDRVTPVVPRDANDKPIEIQARFTEADGRRGMVTAVVSDGNPQTDEDPTSDLENNLPAGAYQFPPLLVGRYEVIANAPDKIDAQTGQLVPNERYNPNYPTVAVNQANAGSYQIAPRADGTPVPVLGNLVEIREGETLRINFFLTAAPQAVQGKVLEEGTNKPIPGAAVRAQLVGTTTDVATATTGPDGSYELRLVNPAAGQDARLLPDGTYDIFATVNGYETVNAPVRVTVGGNSTVVVIAPTIFVRLLPPGAVSGLVQIFNGTTTSFVGVAGAKVTLYPIVVVNGVEQPGDTPLLLTNGQPAQYILKASDEVPPTDGSNWRIPETGFAVPAGEYIAILTKPGFQPDPAFRRVTITSGVETTGVNFTLGPPKVFGAGIQLLSTPFDYSNDSARAVFGLTNREGDNNGNGVPNEAVDRTIYDVFKVADWTGTDYQISPDTNLRPGKGYFVRFGDVTSVRLSRPGVTTAQVNISLNNGWNLIGNPFADINNPADPEDDVQGVDIDLSDATVVRYSYTINNTQRTDVPLSQAVADGAVQSVAYFYTGSLSGSSYVQSGLLRPWLGYWYRAFVPVQMRITNPNLNRSRKLASMVGPDGKLRTITRAQREETVYRSVKSTGTTDWRLQISARQTTSTGELRDVDNTIGVAADAQDGFDNRYDNEKPPVFGEAASLYLALKGEAATGRATSFTDQVKSAWGGKKTWEFTVETSAENGGEVVLSWPNATRLPRGVEPVLVDVTTGRRMAMRSGGSSYRFAPSGRAQRSFRIEVAPPSSLPFDLMNLTVRKGSGGRSTGYRFVFTATKAAEIKAEIQTLAGQTVRRLQTRAQSGVETSLQWDGRSQDGTLIPAGPYVLNLSGKDDQGTQVRRRVMLMNVR